MCVCVCVCVYILYVLYKLYQYRYELMHEYHRAREFISSSMMNININYFYLIRYARSLPASIPGNILKTVPNSPNIYYYIIYYSMYNLYNMFKRYKK